MIKMMHMITTMVGINVLSVDVVSEKVIWILTTLFHRNMVEEIPY
ncbi:MULTISPECIES: hypothetical protein [Eubacterium]|uniref:Uncharacterized protein n=1 Tax=Eubacterium album TaxID=2978477 RepID=A0ABT2LWA0_9FIRM|nr:MULTISPECIES: hypothetical protein [unclassified Eubacterium (in: firmicutes)]MCT7397558.1 hypothetical protein [Eubacterium sp. LFL-14]